MTKRKRTKGQHRSTKYTYKTKDRVTRTTLRKKPGVNSGAPEGLYLPVTTLPLEITKYNRASVDPIDYCTFPI
jgi:hypothetical protein